MNPKHIQAQKEGKAPLEFLVYSVLEGDARVHRSGAEKYGVRNWLKDKILASTYEGAILRHFKAWAEGEDIDPDSGEAHLLHIRACCAILLDSEAHGTLIDDRDRVESKSIVFEEASEMTPEMFEPQGVPLTDFVASKQKIEIKLPPTEFVSKKLPVTDVPHTPTMREIADMEQPEAYDVVFADTDAHGLLLCETTRGPYATLEQAESYAKRNPERLAGTVSIHNSKVKKC